MTQPQSQARPGMGEGKPQDDIVERIAREICINVTDMPMTADEWRVGAAENPKEAEGFRKAARAALTAIREPTDEMLKAGLTERNLNGFGPRGLPLVFASMIDAALAKATAA